MSICEAESEQSREDLSPDFVTQRQKGKHQYEPFSTNGQMEHFRNAATANILHEPANI